MSPVAKSDNINHLYVFFTFSSKSLFFKKGDSFLNVHHGDVKFVHFLLQLSQRLTHVGQGKFAIQIVETL